VVANPYYSSGENLKQKNLLAGGAAVDVPAFALSKVSLGGVASALDAGCGWGRFAVPLLRSAPALEHLVAVDVWPGMLETCRTTVADAGLSARLAAADVRHLPFPNARFDLTMANHMLYELDELGVAAALSELARVTRPHGTLLATTYSDAVEIPMQDLHFETLARLGHPYPAPRASSFSLENGRSQLEGRFADVECHVLDETRSVGDADSLLDVYLRTGGYDWASRDQAIPADVRGRIPDVFRDLAGRRVRADGAITSLTRWTAFVARSPTRVSL